MCVCMYMATYFLGLSAAGPGRNAASGAESTLTARPCFPNITLCEKKLELLGEVPNCTAGSGKVQDEPGVFCARR